MSKRVAFSFVVDQHPKSAYQAWHLAHSLKIYCRADSEDIHLHCTREVPINVEKIFRNEGFQTHRIERFGDGRYCNKLAQLPILIDRTYDQIVLLDTDTIAVSDLRPFLIGSALQAKIVDLPNPSLAALKRIVAAAGGAVVDTVLTDTADELTVLGNANGGFYAIARGLVSRFSDVWRHWALWLHANPGPLCDEGKLIHIDQVSAALAVQVSKLPFSPAPANVNYFIHLKKPHRYFDRSRPIALLHYHDISFQDTGLLVPPIQLEAHEQAAVNRANLQIAEHCQPDLYQAFRESSPK